MLILPAALIALLVFIVGFAAETLSDVIWRAWISLLVALIAAQIGGLLNDWEPILIIPAGMLIACIGHLLRRAAIVLVRS
jgi:hypothetical protein